MAEFDLGNTEEVKRWILSFGRHAVVLEPDELRQEMIEEFAVASSAYGDRPVEGEVLPKSGCHHGHRDSRKETT